MLSCRVTTFLTLSTNNKVVACPVRGAASLHLKNTVSPATALPDFSANDGLLPAIAQDAETGEVLMLAYMNAESFARTQATGEAHYYSRSRRRLWRKGEESGHTQQVQAIFVDCDGDTILLRVTQRGAACHEGYRSCFFRELDGSAVNVVGQRVFDPQEVYQQSERKMTS